MMNTMDGSSLPAYAFAAGALVGGGVYAWLRHHVNARVPLESRPALGWRGAVASMFVFGSLLFAIGATAVGFLVGLFLMMVSCTFFMVIYSVSRLALQQDEARRERGSR